MTGTEHEQKTDASAARPRRPRWQRWAVALAICIGLYAVLGFWAVPAFIERSLPKYAQEELQRKAGVGQVRINPFLLTLEVRDLRLEEASGAPLASVGRLFVDLELKSLLRWAWIVAQLRIEQPAIELVLDADGTLNLARLAEDLAGPELAAAETSAPPRAILEHVVIAEGRVTLTDRSGAEPARLEVAPLDLELRDIATLPERKGPYRLQATLPDGGSAQWEGEVSLQPVASTGRVRATGVKPASAWKLLRERLAIEEPAGSLDAELAYRFAYGRDGVQLSVDPVKLQLKGLRLAFTGAAEPALELEEAQVDEARFDLATRELTIPSLTVRGGRAAINVDAKGELDWQRIVRRTTPGGGAPANAANAAGAPWTFRLGAGRVESFGLRYRDASRKAASELAADSIDARFALEAKAGGGEPLALTLSPLDLELDGVSGGAPGEAPLLRFARMALEGASIDVGARKIRVTKAVVSGGTTQLVRAADGNVGGADLLNPRDEGKIQREVVAEARRAQAEGRPWAVSLERLELERFHASYRDETTQPALALAVKDFGATLQDISTAPDAVVPYTAQLVLEQGGVAKVAGRFALSGARADADLTLERISLKPLAPMVSKLTILQLESGEVSGRAEIALRESGERPTLSVDSGLSVERLLLKEAESGERFLAWRALEAKGLRYRSDPRQLAVKEILLREPGAKIVVSKDRSVNLAKVMKPEQQATPAAAAPKPAPSGAADTQPLSVVVSQVRIADGTIDFADESLVLPFAAKVEKLRGTANGLASDPASRASLKFEGGVGEFGAVRVGGSLAPFQPKRQTDIDVAFRNVEMSTLSPYSATFAGRRIASGRLDLGLKYKVENNALRGDNDIVLRDFTLGETVQSSDAKDLPLDLAVALLKDSEGKIDLAVPVQGDVDNPEFSLSGVIMGALGTALGNLVSAPFRALGGALGAGDAPADAVSFQPGRGVLPPPEREKLEKLAAALSKRPQLRLTVHGGTDVAVDGRAINERGLRKALAEKLGLALGQDEDPGAVAFRDAKTQRALEAVAIERGGEGAVTAFQAKFEKSAGRPAKRVNPALALVGQGSEDEAFYRALFDELVGSAPSPEAALRELAGQRAAEVQRRLTEGTSLAATRVTIGKNEPSSAGKDGVPSRLALGAIAEGG